MVYPKEWENVTCSDWCENESKIWLCLENKNAICEIDKKSKAARILGSFPHNRLGEGSLSLSVKKNGDYIFFCPYKANDVAILKVSTGELQFIDLWNFMDKSKYADFEMEKFYRMVSYKNYIFFLGIKYPAIMRFDLMTSRFEVFDDWLEEIEKHKCKEAVFFTDGYAQLENEIYLPTGRCSGVLKVNLDTMKWDYIELGFAVCGILGMTQRKGFVWFTEQNVDAKKFFQWNLDNDKVVQIELPSQDAFYAPLYYQDTLFFFQNYKGKTYRYDLESGKWEDVTGRVPEIAHSSDKKVRGEEIVYFSKRGRFYHWNPQMDVGYFEEFKIEDKDFLKNSWIDYCQHWKQELKIHSVNEGNLSLRDFIGVIKTI